MEKEIKQIIESANNIAIFGHKNPDGDCIGSMLGLGTLLQKLGKTTKFFTPSLPSKIYDFVECIGNISIDFDYADYDLLIFVDFSSYSRISPFYDANPEYFHKQKIVVFDHHSIEKLESNWKIIHDESSMSACEVIFEITDTRWPNLYESQIATYFYLGLTTDSGNFRYDTDHQRVLGNALKLVNLGADKKYVVDHTFRRKTFAGVKMMERLFSRLTKIGGLVYSRYSQNDLNESGVDREEADFGQVIIQDIEDSDFTAIFRTDETEERVYVSLRSKTINVQQIASQFGGGGHVPAAGFSVPFTGDLHQQIQKIAQQMLDFIGLDK